MRIFVVGGGSWGTAFSALLRDRGHQVTLGCRDNEQARTITATGHNPRYLRTVNLRGVHAMPLDGAPLEEGPRPLQSCMITTAGKGPDPSGLSTVAGICSETPLGVVVVMDRPEAVLVQPPRRLA